MFGTTSATGDDVLAAWTPLLALCLLAAPAPAQDATFLHALIVADTGDALIGPDVRLDSNHVHDRLVQEVPRFRRSLGLLTGGGVTQKEILDYYRKLQVRPTEAVFCFFAGHGATESGEHVLMMSDGGKLRRAELLRAMKDKGARLTVLITDACARAQTQPRGEVFAALRPDRVEACRYLFFRHEGVVDINSSTPPHQYAFGDAKKGGCFTSAFQELLARPNNDPDGDGIVSWREFFEQVSRDTERNYQLLKAKNPGLDQPRQTPYARQLARPVANARLRFADLRLGIQGAEAGGRGVRVVQVFPGSPAEWYGLRSGDVVRRIELMNFYVTSQVAETWDVTDTASMTRAVRTLEEPSLLRCKVADADSGKERTVYLRTLGMRTR